MSDINYKSFNFIVWTDDQLVAGTRKDLQIDVLNAAGQTVIRHRLLRCRVSACQSLPDLDADTNAVAIATLGLETELRTASEEPS